jgi:predicted RNA binding protein YcfA (HicA-like mRNA interferase family)
MRLLPLPWKDIEKAFKADGWVFVRQSSSHRSYKHDAHENILTIPTDNPVAKGTLRSLIRSAGLTMAQFESLRTRGRR